MNPSRILLIVARLLAFASIVQAVACWIFWCSSWTPIERHYLSAYFWSSLPLVGPSTVEVRLIWKTGRHRKPQIATDSDVVGSVDETGMLLSQKARDAGWKALIEGSSQQVPSDVLSSYLASLAFEGQSLGDLFLLPELSALAALCATLGAWYLLIGFFRALLSELAWRRQIPAFRELPVSFLRECAALACTVHSGLGALPRRATQRVEAHSAAPHTTVAVMAPKVKPISFALPLFGVYNRTGSGYLWSEKDAIE